MRTCHVLMSLDVLKVLSGRSWAELDGDVLTLLIVVLPWGKLWQFCVWLHHKIQSIMNPVHNMGVCLGSVSVYCTSSLKHLYAESGEPSMDLWKNLLICAYLVKLATQPHHFSHCVVFQYLYACGLVTRAWQMAICCKVSQHLSVNCGIPHTVAHILVDHLCYGRACCIYVIFTMLYLTF